MYIHIIIHVYNIIDVITSYICVGIDRVGRPDNYDAYTHTCLRFEAHLRQLAAPGHNIRTIHFRTYACALAKETVQWSVALACSHAGS